MKTFKPSNVQLLQILDGTYKIPKDISDLDLTACELTTEDLKKLNLRGTLVQNLSFNSPRGIIDKQYTVIKNEDEFNIRSDFLLAQLQLLDNTIISRVTIDNKNKDQSDYINNLIQDDISHFLNSERIKNIRFTGDDCKLNRLRIYIDTCVNLNIRRYIDFQIHNNEIPSDDKYFITTFIRKHLEDKNFSEALHILKNIDLSLDEYKELYPVMFDNLIGKVKDRRNKLLDYLFPWMYCDLYIDTHPSKYPKDECAEAVKCLFFNSNPCSSEFTKVERDEISSKIDLYIVSDFSSLKHHYEKSHEALSHKYMASINGDKRYNYSDDGMEVLSIFPNRTREKSNLMKKIGIALCYTGIGAIIGVPLILAANSDIKLHDEFDKKCAKIKADMQESPELYNPCLFSFDSDPIFSPSNNAEKYINEDIGAQMNGNILTFNPKLTTAEPKVTEKNITYNGQNLKMN